MVNAILRNLDQKTRAILSAEEVKTLSTTPAEPLSREDIENDLDHGSIRIPDELLSQ
jgi:flagellar biosynthesis/type III secretory pathway ATPase